MFGGQVGVGGHLTIGRGAIAVGQSGVTNSLDLGAFVAGYPAIDSRDWRKASVLFRRLPEMKRRIEQLEARVAELTRDSPNPKGHPSDSGRSQIALRRDGAAGSGVGGFGASARPDPPAEPARTVEFMSRTAFHMNAAPVR